MSDRVIAGFCTLGIGTLGQLGLALFTNSFDVLGAPGWAQVILLAVALVAGAVIWVAGTGLRPEMTFSRELAQLRKDAGTPTISDLEAEMRIRLPSPPTELEKKIESSLAGESRPTWPFAEALINACITHADAQHLGISPTQRDVTRWKKRYDRLFQKHIRLAAAVAVTAVLAVCVVVAVAASQRKEPQTDASGSTGEPASSTSPSSAPVAVSGPTPSATRSANPEQESGIMAPNLMGLTPTDRLTIDNLLTSVHTLDTVQGTSDPLCCKERIWILVQPVGYHRVFPQGYCALRGAKWTCEGKQFGETTDTPGKRYWVTAVVIHDYEESTYREVMTDGYLHVNPPVKPARVSETITVTRV